MTVIATPPATQDLVLEIFQPLVGETFDLVAADHRMTVTLVEAMALDNAPRTETREPFSLLFHGPRAPVYPQGTYGLEHPTLGAHLLMTVPVGFASDAPETMCYQIILG